MNKILKEKVNLKVKNKDIITIMKEKLGMSYRKIKPMSLHANSQKNLVLRQRFAMEFIELMKQGRTVINVDETWLGMTDFRRMKWREKHTTNPIGMAQVVPRISMIVGLDNHG